MKTTGVVRRIDGLGRIVVPKEIRRTLRIRDGEPLEIFVDKDFIALKKYSPMTDFRTLAQILVDSVYDSISLNIFITDRDQCVCGAGHRNCNVPGYWRGDGKPGGGRNVFCRRRGRDRYV